MLQGRLAAAHMFNQPFTPLLPELIPFGIYTIPEVRYEKGREERKQERAFTFLLSLSLLLLLLSQYGWED